MSWGVAVLVAWAILNLFGCISVLLGIWLAGDRPTGGQAQELELLRAIVQLRVIDGTR